MSARRIGRLDQAAIDAIRRLATMQDTLEMAARVDGEIVQLSRQESDDIRDGMRFVSRRICDLAGGV